MKFKFYNKNNKDKEHVINAKNSDDFKKVAYIAKAELTKNSFLKDLDFSGIELYCKVKGDKYNMKELWDFVSDKLSSDVKEKKKDKKDKKKKDKKEKKKDKPKKKDKKKEKK